MSSSHAIQNEDSKDENYSFYSHLTLENFLKSNPFPKRINFSPNDQLDEKKAIPAAIFELAERMQHARNNPILNLENAFHREESANYFVDMLSAAPTGLTLIIKGEEKFSINSLAKAFVSGACQHWPKSLTLIVPEYPMLVDAFAQVLQKRITSADFCFIPYPPSARSLHGHKSLSKMLKVFEKAQNDFDARIGMSSTLMAYRKKNESEIADFLLNNNIKIKLKIEASQSALSVYSVLFALYKSTSAISIKLPSNYDSEALDILKNIMKVNDSLIDIAFTDYIYPRSIEETDAIDEQMKLIQPYLDKNKYHAEAKQLLPILDDFFPHVISEIILTYKTGEPRKMHQEVIEAFEKDELNIAYLILQRKPSLLDEKVKVEKQILSLDTFIKNRIHTKNQLGYSPSKNYDNMIITWNGDSINEKELYDLFDKLIKDWESSKIPKGNVIVNFVSSFFIVK